MIILDNHTENSYYQFTGINMSEMLVIVLSMFSSIFSFKMEDLPEIPDLSFLNREKDCTDHSNHLPGRPCDTWSTKSQTLSSKLKAKVDKLKKGRQNRSAVRSVLPSRQNKNGEVPGDKDVQESRQKDMTDPGGGDDASSSTQDGVVQIEDPTGKGKQMYRNCLGHEFVLDLTEEVEYFQYFIID